MDKTALHLYQYLYSITGSKLNFNIHAFLLFYIHKNSPNKKNCTNNLKLSKYNPHSHIIKEILKVHRRLCFWRRLSKSCNQKPKKKKKDLFLITILYKYILLINGYPTDFITKSKMFLQKDQYQVPTIWYLNLNSIRYKMIPTKEIIHNNN